MTADGEEYGTRGRAERPRLKGVNHEAPDSVSTAGVFDRGAAERTARERTSEEAVR